MSLSEHKEVESFLDAYVREAARNGVHLSANEWGIPGSEGCMCLMLDLVWRLGDNEDRVRSVVRRGLWPSIHPCVPIAARILGVTGYQVDRIVSGWDNLGLSSDFSWRAVGQRVRIEFDRAWSARKTPSSDAVSQGALGK